MLTVSDLRESRVVVTDPAPIPAEELERTADWLKSWGMLEKTGTPASLVNNEVQSHAHIAAGQTATPSLVSARFRGNEPMWGCLLKRDG